MFRWFLSFSAAILMFVSVASAQPGVGIMAAAEDLGLSEQQMEKISDMGFKHQKAMIQKKAALQEAELELRQLLKKKSVDEKAALSIQDKVSGLKSEMARTKLQHKLAMRNALTPEQLDKWMKMRKSDGFREMKHHGRDDDRRGMGHPKGMGPGPGFGD